MDFLPAKLAAMTRFRRRLKFFIVALAPVACTFSLTAADPEADRLALAVEALTRLEGVDLNANATLKERVLKVLDKTRGTPNFVRLVQHFQLKDQNTGLLEVAAAQPASESGVAAMRLVLASGDPALVQAALDGTNAAVAVKIAEVLGNTSDKQSAKLLLPVVTDSKRDLSLRKQSVRSLAKTSGGAHELLQLARTDKLADDLKFTASAELNAVRWAEIKTEAAKVLPPVQGRNAAPLPPISELVKMKGDSAAGARIFTNAVPGCASCHVVNGRGAELGPNLSEIGTKLGRDALFEAILDPSAGISFGFEAWNVALKNGDEVYGLIGSETADEVAVKSIGGIVTRLKKSEIASRQQSRLSIMPAGLQTAMTAQELADLVEYLVSLKKAGPTP
jgi:putative heme-binding domain-containing protein